MSDTARTLAITQPTVYLDQWVWIRLARARKGRPREASDVALLDALMDARRDGVIFPLSATHYEETGRILDPKQRRDLVEVMAPISQMRTIRYQSDLINHQVRVAFHQVAGRPTFRPLAPEVFGIGVHWAFRGITAFFKVVDRYGEIVRGVDGSWLRRVNQYGEAAVLGGPADEELGPLGRLGYVPPRSFETAKGNRLAWEQVLAERIATEKVPRDELRVWLLARELSHEYIDIFNSLLAEFRLHPSALGIGGDSKNARRNAIDFAELIPTLRVAADLKLQVFRNGDRRWDWNILRDIDALSIAIPYCDVVIADREAVSFADRSKAPQRHNTVLTSELGVLADVLPDLKREARKLGGERSAWDALGPASEFALTTPAPLPAGSYPAGAAMRLVDEHGRPVAAPD